MSVTHPTVVNPSLVEGATSDAEIKQNEPTKSALSVAVTATGKSDVPASKVAENVADSSVDSKVTEKSLTDAGVNPVKKIADEIVSKMGDIQDHKDNLMAMGIPFNTVNVLVEMSIHGRGEDLENMRMAAVETSRKQHGAGGISAEKLSNTLDALVGLEKDLGLVRRLGQQQGLNMTALNHLTMLIRLSPGDGGVQVVNTLLAYALACEVPLDKVTDLADEITAGPASVLPKIDREGDVDLVQAARTRLLSDIAIGCVMAVIALTILT